MITIDLFSLCVLFPLCGSYVTPENFFFQLKPYLGACVRIKKTRAVFLENIVCLFYLFVSCLLVFLSGLAKGAPLQ